MFVYCVAAGQLTGAAFTVTESDQGIVISCDGIGYTRERAASGIGSAKRKRDSGGAGAASASGAK